ncbi:hypothetical protein G7092_16650 [Mucilaginibacter sp. HC2]|uniref:DUF6660 family protein n=1 Tax=Mucilaginibacter inviolabilis TaxID=2714892 RepID=UPI00140ABB63|nr:DUF6660 family protein [Mucilaginibacter inviolabilis]NHA05442.1 hypothetical protein [Mucilaginibacter inviolabilis]
MKYIAIIISLYVSLLSVMPCQDRDDAVWAQTHLTIRQAHDGNKGCSRESCTPLCSCSCCSSVRDIDQQVYIPSFQQNTFVPYPDLIIPALSEQDIAIWQPPQLS